MNNAFSPTGIELSAYLGKSRLATHRRAYPMAGNVMEFTDANWQSEVLDSPVPVLVDFWAPWCGPCRMLAPTIEKLAGVYQGKIKIGKMNTDQNPDTPGGLGVSAIPTVLLFKQGREVDRLVGVNSEAKFKEVLAQMGVE
jgi:thioredoxin